MGIYGYVFDLEFRMFDLPYFANHSPNQQVNFSPNSRVVKGGISYFCFLYYLLIINK